MRGATLAVLACAAACRPAPPALDSCADPLGGVWRALPPDGTTPSGEPRRYHALSVGRGEVELYPMFDDSVVAPGAPKLTTADAVIAAPAVFDLVLSDDGAARVGRQTRRLSRGGATCVLTAPAGLRACHGDRAQLDATPITGVTDWTACVPSPAAPITWTLIRERD